MTDVSLKGVHRVVSKGNVYYYAWRGGPRLPGKPGSVEFLDAFIAASRHTEDAKLVGGAVIAYKDSDAWKRIADTTKRTWSPWLDHIRNDLGQFSLRAFDRPQIRKVIKNWRDKWKDRPRAADTAKQVLSAVLSHAVEEGNLGANPCFGISNIYSANRAEIIWTEADIAKLVAVASQEVAWALRLACLTGLRKSDLLALKWAQVNDLSIDMSTSKSGGSRTAVVPLYADLRALLAEIPRRAATVLTNSDGEPWKGFSSSWTKAKIDAGLKEMHFHDARGTAATRFYVAGFPLEEIAEILAWEKNKVERIINRYVRRDALLRAKIERMDKASQNA